MKFFFAVALALLLLLPSCSRQTSPVSTWHGPRSSAERSTRYHYYNQPISEVGIHAGMTTLNTRFTGVYEQSFGDKLEYYTENLSGQAGGFFRFGLSEKFGLNVNLNVTKLSGSFGLSPYEHFKFTVVPREPTGDHFYEDNFFEGTGLIDPGQLSGSIGRFDNTLTTVSLTSYYYLPFFDYVPMQWPKATRLYVYTGVSFMGNNTSLYNIRDTKISEEITADKISPDGIGIGVPVGLGFSYRITPSLSIGYEMDYTFSPSNRGSGIIDDDHIDRLFSTRFSVAYRLNGNR